MARGGIYRSEVARARDNLVAMGRHPSIDAIRVELGNTGSKSTIHRLLKEVEEDEANAGEPKIKVGDAVLELAGRLAARLEVDSNARLIAAQAEHEAQSKRQVAELAAAKAEGDALRAELQKAQLSLAREVATRESTEAALVAKTNDHQTVVDQIISLRERLQAEEAHRVSLETAQQHARESLEHFRQAAKEQREREQRQHEHQVQHLQSELAKSQDGLAGKQVEIRLAHQEKLELLAELKTARVELRHREEQIRQIQPLQDKVAAQQQLVSDLQGSRSAVNERMEALQAQSDALAQRNLELERAGAGMGAALEAQEKVVKSLMERLTVGSSPRSRKAQSANTPEQQSLDAG